MFEIGRKNLALTVMVPWDCCNNCPFCTSKESYKGYSPNTLNIRMNLLIDTLKKFNRTIIEEVVITGGEPFADLAQLKKIINVISPKKKVYINTTFPCINRYNASKIADYINNEDKIKGISISRHCTSFEADTQFFNPNILKDRWLFLIKKPVRINCVLYEDTAFLYEYTIQSKYEYIIQSVIERYKNAPYNVSINFRADFNQMNRNQLHSKHDLFLDCLHSVGLKYISSTQCDVCHTDIFESDGRKILYHRGIPNTAIRKYKPSRIQVNDIILKQDGMWCYDWDGKNKDEEELFYMLLKPRSTKSENTSRRNSNSYCGISSKVC